jgi:hypothetical protein
LATTTNLGLTLPTVGADDDTWGGVNNTVHTGVDAVFKADGTGTSVGLKVGSGKTLNVTGGTLVGFPDSPVPYGHINGLTLSAAGSTATFGIATGQAADSTNAALMSLGSAYTKTGSSWAVGSGNGGIDTGSIANNTWYHVWLIQRSDTSVVDVLFSTSASSPTMPSNYDRKRRIGSMLTNGSAQWVKFIQDGDRFDWDTRVLDSNGSTPANTSAASKTLTVPTGVSVQAIVEGTLSYSSGAMFAIFSPLDVADIDPGATGWWGVAAASAYNTAEKIIRTNTSAQIRIRFSSTTGNYTIATSGWLDARGR